MFWRLAFEQLIGIMPDMSLRFWSLWNIFELDKVIFAEIPGINFELKVLKLRKYFIIVEVSIAEQDVLLSVDRFINLNLFFLSFVNIDLNGNISESGFKLFSPKSFFFEFMFIFLISEIHDIELAFGLAGLGIGIAFVPVDSF